MSKSHLQQLIDTPEEEWGLDRPEGNRNPKHLCVDVYFKPTEAKDQWGNRGVAGPGRKLYGNYPLSRRLFEHLAECALYGVGSNEILPDTEGDVVT